MKNKFKLSLPLLLANMVAAASSSSDPAPGVAVGPSVLMRTDPMSFMLPSYVRAVDRAQTSGDKGIQCSPISEDKFERDWSGILNAASHEFLLSSPLITIDDKKFGLLPPGVYVKDALEAVKTNYGPQVKIQLSPELSTELNTIEDTHYTSEEGSESQAQAQEKFYRVLADICKVLTGVTLDPSFLRLYPVSEWMLSRRPIFGFSLDRHLKTGWFFKFVPLKRNTFLSVECVRYWFSGNRHLYPALGLNLSELIENRGVGYLDNRFKPDVLTHKLGALNYLCAQNNLPPVKLWQLKLAEIERQAARSSIFPILVKSGAMWISFHPDLSVRMSPVHPDHVTIERKKKEHLPDFFTFVYSCLTFKDSGEDALPLLPDGVTSEEALTPTNGVVDFRLNDAFSILSAPWKPWSGSNRMVVVRRFLEAANLAAGQEINPESVIIEEDRVFSSQSDFAFVKRGDEWHVRFTVGTGSMGTG